MLTLGFLQQQTYVPSNTLSLAAPSWSTSDVAAGSEGQEYFQLLTWIQYSHFPMKAIT